MRILLRLIMLIMVPGLAAAQEPAAQDSAGQGPAAQGAGTAAYALTFAPHPCLYFQKDKRERIKTRSHDLNKMLKNLCDRLNRKIDIQKREFESSKNREELRVKADIINANLYRIEKIALAMHDAIK